MVRRRLSRELHGSGGYTSLTRLVAGFGLVVAIGLAAYLGGSTWYLGRMLPGTHVGTRDLSGFTLPQARQSLVNMAQSASVGLSIGGETYQFAPADLGVAYNVDQTLAEAYTKPRLAWYQQNSGQRRLGYSYTVASGQMQQAVATVAAKIGTQPVDAALVVKNGELVKLADKDGFTLDKLALARLIDSRLGEAAPLSLTAAPQRQTAQIRVASLDMTMSAARQWMATSLTLTYGERTWTPAPATIGSWLVFVKDPSGPTPRLVPQVDQSRVKAYVQTLARQADVAPVNELVTVQNGARTVNQAGVDGSAINQDAVVAALSAAVAAQQPLALAVTDRPVAFKSVVTNFTVLDDPKYIEVNLSKQHLWVWENGQIIFDTAITSGATGAGFPTVTGKFAINAKVRNTHLRGYQYGPRYNYDVEVKYWMPFYSGYGLHDASWRNGKFGGSDYYYGGSHGCVNLPDAAADYIFNWAEVGTPIWVHT